MWFEQFLREENKGNLTFDPGPPFTLSSSLIKYFQFGKVLINDLWIIQKYIVGEDISIKSTLDPSPEKNSLRSVSSK